MIKYIVNIPKEKAFKKLNMFLDIKKIIIPFVAVSVGWVSSIFTFPSRNLDLNNDGIVDVLDVQQILKVISSEGKTNTLPDLNNDGKVDVKDLQILLNNLGKKVVNVDKSVFTLYFPSTSMNLIKQDRFKNVGVAKFLYLIFNNSSVLNKFRGDFRNKTFLIREYFFPVTRVKGSLSLALHISPLSPPLS